MAMSLEFFPGYKDGTEQLSAAVTGSYVGGMLIGAFADGVGVTLSGANVLGMSLNDKIVDAQNGKVAFAPRGSKATLSPSLSPALDKLIITKSYNMGGTELNYEQTWDDGDFGIPIFTIEDAFANTNLMASAQEEMGVYPATIYSGNMFLGPGLGTFDENADLNEEYTRLGVQSLVKSVEIVCKYAGLED